MSSVFLQMCVCVCVFLYPQILSFFLGGREVFLHMGNLRKRNSQQLWAFEVLYLLFGQGPDMLTATKSDPRSHQGWFQGAPKDMGGSPYGKRDPYKLTIKAFKGGFMSLGVPENLTDIKMNQIHPGLEVENSIVSMVSFAKKVSESPSIFSVQRKQLKEFGALVLAATMNMRQVLSILASYVLHLGPIEGMASRDMKRGPIE